MYCLCLGCWCLFCFCCVLRVVVFIWICFDLARAFVLSLLLCYGVCFDVYWLVDWWFCICLFGSVVEFWVCL